MKKEYSKEIVDRLKKVTAKRPKTVIDHILEHGFITSEQLKNEYGYNHPPRAVRDVREHDIPIVTSTVKGTDGRLIAKYTFGDFAKKKLSKMSGRTNLSKKIKNELVKKYGSKDFIYGELIDETGLQVDHRIPFEISGESEIENFDNFMLLSGSTNRAKSWSCEHCENWNEIKERKICSSCYWAYPENYTHIAMTEIGRIDLLWQGEDLKIYTAIKERASKMHKEVQEIIKDILEKAIEENKK
ncbi:MAG TPA: HNH endonuclease [Gammaproteobacteria bacterium]|nr:HNH endonuclease [Gammaproteobacteria bacterium]